MNKIRLGSAFELAKELEDESIDCIMTSPPYYGLRDYGIEGQLGHEKRFREYLDKLLELFKTLKDKLKKEGTCWVNISDTYGDKSLMLIPERFAMGMIS